MLDLISLLEMTLSINNLVRLLNLLVGFDKISLDILSDSIWIERER